MALNRKQREILIKNIGFLDGISWVFAIDEHLTQFAEAMDCVCSDLRKVLDDGGEDDAN